jgi:hypothetical protein
MYKNASKAVRLMGFPGDVVQSVRTPACHAGGREFEPRRPRHQITRAANVAALFTSVSRNAILKTKELHLSATPFLLKRQWAFLHEPVAALISSSWLEI